MARIVDLTRPITDGMAVFPGDPPVSLRPALRLRDGDDANVTALALGSHTGTHVDAPLHVDDGAAPLEAIALERLVGRPIVADVRGGGPPGIVPEELADVLALDLADRILVLRTRSDDGRTRHLEASAARAIVAATPLAIGTDALSVDAADDAALPAHRALLGAGIPIIEDLTGIERLARLVDPILVVLPLAISGADGAPVRAVALERAAAGG